LFEEPHVTRGSQKEGELDNDDNKNNSEEFVMPKGHVVADQECKDVRKSTRIRESNRRLGEYELEIC